MLTIYKRLSVITGFAFLLILVAAGTFVTARQVALEQEDYDWVLHSRAVIGELYQTESLIKDAETGQRGYLYTRDRNYLSSYYEGVSQTPVHLDRLSQLIADNSSERARMSVLRDLTGRKLAELGQTIALQDAGDAEKAYALVTSNLGLHTMEAIRAKIAEMEQEENALAAERETTYHRRARFTETSIYISGVATAIGLVLLAYFILHEMDLREQYSARIREREEWYRLTLTSLGDGVIATDGQGLVTFLNPIAEILTGRSLPDAQGQPIVDVFPIFNEFSGEPVENPVEKVLTGGRIVGLANHTVLRGPDGSLTPIEDSAAPIRDMRGRVDGVVLVFRDATPERHTQELVRRTEKLAAAARLAATVSHEINNPLEAIGNLIYIVKTLPELPAAATEPLDLAERELERVAHITRQTLGFYRESKPPEPVDLVGVIEYVLKLYSNRIKAQAVVVETSFEACTGIYGVRGELTQAVSNLILNAMDVTRPGGTIWIRLTAVEFSELPWTELTVEDSGPGVPEELREKIFEPFFTTKKDVGTGLGLWLTKEIVERHGASIQVSSSEGSGARGAVFRVRFPAAYDPAAFALRTN